MNQLMEMWATTSGCNTDGVKLWSEQPKWDPCIKAWRVEGEGFSRYLPRDMLKFLCQTGWDFDMKNSLYHISSGGCISPIESHSNYDPPGKSLLSKLRKLVDEHEGDA